MRVADKQLVSGAEFLKRDGSVPLTGTFDAGSQLLSNVAEPVAGSDAATKTYADSVGGGGGLTDWAADAPALSLTGWYDAFTVGGGVAANPAAALVGGGIMLGIERNAPAAPPHEVTGLLRDIAAGDFRVGFVVSAAMHNTTYNMINTHTGFVGACFLDGQSADIGDDNLYAMGMGWGNAAFPNPSATGYRTTLAGERWDAAESSISSTTYYAENTIDVVLERVGTNLTAYWARRGHPFSHAVAPWTVGIGAGRIGIRGRFEGSLEVDYMRAFVRAFDPALAAVPYRT